MSKFSTSVKWHDEEEDIKTNSKVIVMNSIPHIHHTNDSLAAIYYIYYLVSSFDTSKRCYGIKFSQWFPYLIENKLYHPLVCLSNTIHVEMNQKERNKKQISFSLMDEADITCNNKKNNQDNSNIVIVPLILIKSIEEQHAYMLIINHITCTIEFFDSMGILNEQDILFESFIQDNWNSLLKVSKTKALKYKFNAVMQEITCPLQQTGKNQSLPCQEDTYCLTYSTIYAHLRLLSPDVASEQLIQTWSTFPKKQTNEMILKYIAWQEQVLSSTSFLF